MPQTKIMKVGERERLRAPDAVQRWLSKDPRVVSVSDEDIVHGHAGGEVSALAPGRARVQAIGFDDQMVVDVEISVEERQPIAVTAGQTTQLGPPQGGARWVSRNRRVAEVDASGHVRGVSPGITYVHVEGSREEVEVRVAGMLDVEVNQTIALADRFAVPVRGWRLSSSNVATIDDRGTLTAGNHPRTVAVFVNLENGDEFSFDLRIRAGGADGARAAVAPATPGALPPSAGPQSRQEPVSRHPGPTSGLDVNGPAAQLDAGLEQAVATHLSRAENHIQNRQWEAAKRALVDADLITLGHGGLKARVQQMRSRLDRAIADFLAATCHGIVSALRRNDYTRARAALQDVCVSKHQSALVDQLSGLTDLLEFLGSENDYTEDKMAKLYACLEQACRTALGLRMAEVVAMGAQIAVDRQIVQMGSFLAEAISSRQLLDMSEAVRGSLRASLIGMEGAGFEAIVDRLARTSIGDPAGLWLLDALVDMDPANYAGSMVRMYRAFSPKEQSQLVGWLCKMGEQSCDVLLTLVGGTLRRYPVDRRIAEAIQRRIGVDDLEKVAIKWWTRKHVPGADLILRILYNYPPETLMR